MPLRIMHVVACIEFHSFLWPNKGHCIYAAFFICSSADRHLGCFYQGCCNAAVHMGGQYQSLLSLPLQIQLKPPTPPCFSTHRKPLSRGSIILLQYMAIHFVMYEAIHIILQLAFLLNIFAIPSCGCG